MLNLWHDLPAGMHVPECVTAVIEIPSGSRNKYELDKSSGMLKLDRVLFSAVHYPGDYGFIPRTLHEDGDPLDVLVLVKQETFPGCQIDEQAPRQPARPVGEFAIGHRARRGVDVPPQVEAAVRHALEKEPKYRTPSADELIGELRAAMASVSITGACESMRLVRPARSRSAVMERSTRPHREDPP